MLVGQQKGLMLSLSKYEAGATTILRQAQDEVLLLRLDYRSTPALRNSADRRPVSHSAIMRKSLISDQNGWVKVAGRLPSIKPWAIQAGP